MKAKRAFLAGTAALLLIAPGTAMAQLAVLDNSNLAQAITTARNSLKQIEEAQRLYQSVSQITDISSVGQVLNSDLVRRGLPADVQQSLKLTSNDLSELGSIGDRATQLLQAKNLSSALSSADSALGSAARVAARDQAVAEAGLAASEQTTQGIGQLKDRLATSSSAKETADLQARATLEVAQLLNQANQREALKDAQRAQRSLDIARYNEERRKADAEAAKSGRMPRFRQ